MIYVDSRYKEVGRLCRTETEGLIVGYTFDLRTNELRAERMKNPQSGGEHRFVAYRLSNQAMKPVSMVEHGIILEENDGSDE